MKKTLLAVAFLVLAAQIPLWGYDLDPNFLKIVPEVIWAAATGGGTWVTELQITNVGPTTAGILASFRCAGGGRGVRLSFGLEQYHSLRFPNILETFDMIDSSSFVYYGKVGALVVQSEDLDCQIQVQARTVNGNFGKSMPGMSFVAGMTAAQGRPMIIQDIVKSSMYRTSIGLYNTSGDYTYSVQMAIINADGVQVGSIFQKTLGPIEFVSFNPFTAAGVTSGDYKNCWLLIDVIAGGSDPKGVMCYGSVANNYTNDSFALLPVMFNAI